MEWALFGVVAIVSIVAAGAFANRLGVAAPLLLIVLGVGFSFIPGAPTTVPPEIILAGLLPPILYASAVNVPVMDFKRNFSSIFGLSVLLVIVSAFVTGRAAEHPVPEAQPRRGRRAGRRDQPDGCGRRDRDRQEARPAAAAGHHPRGRGAGQRRDRARAAAVRDRGRRSHGQLLGSARNVRLRGGGRRSSSGSSSVS